MVIVVVKPTEKDMDRKMHFHCEEIFLVFHVLPAFLLLLHYLINRRSLFVYIYMCVYI